jgi:hypothetical protein
MCVSFHCGTVFPTARNAVARRSMRRVCWAADTFASSLAIADGNHRAAWQSLHSWRILREALTQSVQNHILSPRLMRLMFELETKVRALAFRVTTNASTDIASAMTAVPP